MRPSIQAGAGTGKTTRVVRLLLDRVLSTDTEPSRLLALTFTVRAANEMRDRLGTWLARLVDGQKVLELGGGIGLFDEPERARRRGQRVLAELDRIEMGTIHSFAAHLLRQYPIEAGVSPSFVEDDGAGEASLFRELWSPWLETRLGDPTHVAILSDFLERSEMRDLRSFAAILCREDVPLDWHQEDETHEWADRLREAAERTQRLLAEYGEGSQTGERRVMDTLRYMDCLFTSPDVTPVLRRQARLLDERWPTAREWKAAEPEYRELRRLARALVDCDDGKMKELIEWLHPFVESFRHEYTRRGFASFQGLLVRAAGVLRDHPDVRGQLKRRFRLVLVDEFQDTDPLQGEILLFLAERSDRCETDSRSVEVEPGKLVIVGDEKQSIYLFRGADLEAYEAIARRLTEGRDDQVERLSVNYRSRPELVRFVNAIGARTMRTPEYAPIDPGPLAGTGGRVEMILFPGLDADQARASEAEAIAGWVTENVARGEFHPGEVAVLLRTLEFADHYTAAFRQCGIDFVIEGEKHFYAAQEVLDVLNLLGAVVDPTDELAVAGLLRSPLGAVRDRELAELRVAGAMCPLDGDRVPARLSQVRRLYDLIAQLHASSRRVPAADLIRDLLQRLPVMELAREGLRGEQAVANVRKLIEALVREGGGALSQALTEYRRRFRERDEEGEAVLGDDQHDAVRILSIHKAKGLEFPVVVLADLHREHPVSEGRPFLREWLSGRVGFRCGALSTRPWIDADERYRRMQADEERRLLYVALTRAKDRMLLTGGRPNKGFLGLIVSALGDAGLTIGAVTEQRLRGDGFEVDVHLRDRVEESSSPRTVPITCEDVDYEDENRRWAARQSQGLQLAEIPVLRHPSASALPQGGDPRGILESDLDRVTRLERDDETVDGPSVGSRCHDVLATMDLGEAVCTGVDDAVRVILDPFFQSQAFREIQGADRIHREVPFLIELDGTKWSGQIDVLYRFEGRWVVADYKSDRGEQPERYRTQARVYTRAAQQALQLEEPPEFRLIYLRTGKAVRL